jgi:hypothetical protein
LEAGLEAKNVGNLERSNNEKEINFVSNDK